MDVNTTIPLIDGMISSVHYLVNLIQVLVGGLFGLYLILVILRWKESRELKKIMKDLRDEIKGLNDNLNKLNDKNVKEKSSRKNSSRDK